VSCVLLQIHAANVEQVSSDADLLQLIKRSVGSVFHASCTCAMGRKDDKNAVVDSNANVIGVNGLRVVDASAFPFLPPGHPMATVCEFVSSSRHLSVPNY
jgi:choline dehydrogenase